MFNSFNDTKDKDALCHVTVVHNTDSAWPVERTFYWRLPARLLFDPDGIEEAFCFLCSNIGIDRNKVRELTIAPVPCELPVKQTIRLLDCKQLPMKEGKGQ